jgi:glycosyltransferase involved in cell wall biosynthesis
MNILLINHYAGSLQLGMEYRPFYLAREWMKSGHNVRILAASFAHTRSVQPNKQPNLTTELVEGICFQWIDTPKYQGNGIGRIWNMLRFVVSAWRAAPAIVDEFKPDVVIASSTYPMDIWAARRIARLAKAKLVFEVHDLWPLSPMSLGGMSRWHPFIMLVQVAEDTAYRVSDQVVSILPKTLEYMRTRGLDPAKWSHVPNGIALQDYSQKSEMPSDVALGIQNIKRTGLPLIGYAGAHGVANALDTLLDAAILLRGKAEFILVGKGPEKERLLARVQKEKIHNMHFLGSIPKQSVPTFLNSIDIAYIGWEPCELYKFGIAPNKLMDYMMAAKAIVHSVDAGNDLVADANCGLSVPPNDPIAIVRAIEKLIALPEEDRRTLGKNGQQFVRENHSYEILADNFIHAIQVQKEHA